MCNIVKTSAKIFGGCRYVYDDCRLPDDYSFLRGEIHFVAGFYVKSGEERVDIAKSSGSVLVRSRISSSRIFPAQTLAYAR